MEHPSHVVIKIDFRRVIIRGMFERSTGQYFGKEELNLREVRSKDAFVRVALFSSLDPSPGPSSTIDNCTNLAVDKDAV